MDSRLGWLGTRYASARMAQIWDQPNQIMIEHHLWLTVMRMQQDAGVKITDDDIKAYEKIADDYRTDRNNYREVYHTWVDSTERSVRHDLVARLMVFDSCAGNRGKAHLGLTSSDVTENTHHTLIDQAMDLLAHHAVAVLMQIVGCARRWSNVVIAGRTHNRPAQPVTVGYRFAVAADELRAATERLLVTVPRIRGLGGAVGTRADLKALVDHDPTQISGLGGVELGTGRQLATGQVGQRTELLPAASAAYGIGTALGSLATTLRLMAGYDLISEVRADGQIGSSAMPHKTNPILAERICGLLQVTRGYLSTIESSAGVTWQEGDVSDSVVRRVAWPGLFLAVDGMLRAAMSMIPRLVINRQECAFEVGRNPELATGQLLAAAVNAGANRFAAHRALMDAFTMWRSNPGESTWIGYLEDDDRFPLDRDEILAVHARVEQGTAGLGTVAAQIQQVYTAASDLAVRFPSETLDWDPGVVL